MPWWAAHQQHAPRCSAPFMLCSFLTSQRCCACVRLQAQLEQAGSMADVLSGVQRMKGVMVVNGLQPGAQAYAAQLRAALRLQELQVGGAGSKQKCACCLLVQEGGPQGAGSTRWATCGAHKLLAWRITLQFLACLLALRRKLSKPSGRCGGAHHPRRWPCWMTWHSRSCWLAPGKQCGDGVLCAGVLGSCLCCMGDEV